MEFVSSQSKLSLDQRIDGMFKDSEDILYKLNKLTPPSDRPIEIVAELPAAVFVDVLVATVQRWCEIQKHFDRELRIYAWSYNAVVEKYVLNLVRNNSNVLVTILPMYLKGDVFYVK